MSLINVKSYTPTGGKYRLRWRVRGQRSDWVICSLQRCRQWGDLYCLAKWLLASHVLIHLRSQCWPHLASWAWLRWDERESLPGGGKQCKAEADRCGSCWCGKFTNPRVMNERYPKAVKS